MPVPERVLVYGVTGSGKSTAARAIGARTGLPVVLADELTWEPDWVAVPLEEQRRRLAEVVSADRWVLDTSYSSWSDLVLPRVQLVVGLDYPRWLSLTRLLRRSVTRAVTREPICNGNVETFRLLVSRESIVAWHFRSFRRKRDRMRAWAADPDAPPVLLVDRPRRLEAWLSRIGE